MAKASSVAIFVVAILAVPVLLCGGCLTLGFVGMAVTPKVPQTEEPTPVVKQESKPAQTVTPAKTPKTFSRWGEVITLQEYSRIETGMTYAEVVAVIGAHGEEVSSNDIGGTKTIMYVWKNSFGPNANVMFQNDMVIQKSQFGLPDRPGSEATEEGEILK